MSLSLIVRCCLFGMLIGIAALAGHNYARPVLTYVVEAREFGAREARISKRSIAYRIPTEKAVSFQFTQPLKRSKILINPSVTEKMRDHPGGFVFGLRFRWLNAESQPISEHEVFLQADSPDEVFRSGDVWRFFRARPELVAEQDLILLESAIPASGLQIEAFDLDDGIVGIDLRVFEQRTYLGEQSLSAFRRLSDATKDQLTAPNPFPAAMISQEEKLVLGRNHWRAVGPIGLDKRDYTKLVLYEAFREDLFYSESLQAGGMP